MANYRVVAGTFFVTPTKSEFTTDESVTVRIQCTIERDLPFPGGTAGDWESDYYLVVGATRTWIDSRHHGISLHSVDDFVAGLGMFSKGTLTGDIVVEAHG